MTPSFYAGSEAASLCELVRMNRTDAASRMRRHLHSFVAEEDFAWLAARGYNAVRVPLGYWNAVDVEGGIPYVPDASESLQVLDRLFDWGDAHGLGLLLDMHAAPGSQNGADHSGCDSDGINWHTEPDNIRLSLAAIDALARRYGPHSALLGIEVLNEPAWAVEWDHGQLLEYYTRAADLVYAASPRAYVVFNVLYWGDFPSGFGDWWTGQLVSDRVLIDLHLYDCFGDAALRTIDEHRAQAREWSRAIRRFSERGHKVRV